MPNIRSYEAPNLVLQPSETGIEATAQAANRIGRFYNQQAAGTEQVGDQLARGVSGDIKAAGDVAVKYVDFQDRNKLDALVTKGMANAEQSWNDTLNQAVKNPDLANDPALAHDFVTNKIQPILDQLDQTPFGENGQKYAQELKARLAQHWNEKTAADTSTVAGNAAIINHQQTANNLAAVVTSSPDFHTVDMALKQWDISSSNLPPTVSGVEASRLSVRNLEMKQQIVHAAVASAISKSSDPEGVVSSFAQKYPDLIKPAEEMQMAKAAKVQSHVNLAADRQAQLAKKQLDELNTHKAANDAFNKNVTIDQATGRPILNPQYFKDALDIAKNNPNAPNAATVAKTMIDWGESQQRAHNEVIQTDPATQKGLLDRVFDPTNPTSTIDVLRAEADHKLSTHDGQVMRQLVEATQGQGLKGPVYQTAIDAAKERLGVSTLVDGHERYANFMSTFWPEYLRQRAGGTLAPDALNLNDPNSLISKSLKAYEPTPAQRLQAHMLKTIGGTMPLNLTGPNSTITGVSVENAPPFRPPPTWQYSPSRGQYRDPQGKVYDAAGKPVK